VTPRHRRDRPSGRCRLKPLNSTTFRRRRPRQSHSARRPMAARREIRAQRAPAPRNRKTPRAQDPRTCVSSASRSRCGDRHNGHPPKGCARVDVLRHRHDGVSGRHPPRNPIPQRTTAIVGGVAHRAWAKRTTCAQVLRCHRTGRDLPLAPQGQAAQKDAPATFQAALPSGKGPTATGHSRRRDPRCSGTEGRAPIERKVPAGSRPGALSSVTPGLPVDRPQDTGPKADL
jgi:hypothetical protein